MNKTEDLETPIKAKADWLVNLEQQSWQAELLVSSIAIFGTLQLPSLIMTLIDSMLIHLPRDMMGWMPFFICFYLIMASVGLAILFIYHFVVRSFWIGIIGLISAYPEGIKFDKSQFSDYIVAKLQQHYPDIDAYNQSLDHRCSTIFASAFLIASSILGAAIGSVALLFMCYMLAKVLPYDAQAISIVIGLLLFIFVILGGLLNLKLFRDIEYLKRPHYIIFAASSLLVYTIFWRSAGYIALTFRTHQGAKVSSIFQLVLIGLVTVVALPIINNSNIDLFLEDKYTRTHANSNTLYQDAFEDQRADDYALYPTIPSYEIDSKQLRLFIPELAREQSVLDSLMPPPEPNSKLSKREKTNVRVSHLLKQTAKFHSLFINDTKIDDALYFYREDNGEQKGVIALIDSKHLSDGHNLLKIVKAYVNSKGEPMEIYINFFYSTN